MNFDFVTDRLAIGTTPESLDDIATLLASAVTHIIDCRAEMDLAPLLDGTPYSVKGRYLWAGTEDWVPFTDQHKPVDWFKLGIEYALPVLAAPNSKVYVFCHMGANRSATLAWTILRALGMSTSECFLIIDSHRAIAVPGLIECGWWRDAESALKTLGYL